MTEPKPTYKTRGRGRPTNGDYPVKIFARISEEDADIIKSLGNGSISEGVRRLCAEYRRSPGRPPADPSP